MRPLSHRLEPLAWRVARRLGYHLVRADVYSPIPEVRDLPERLFAEPDAMPGVAIDVEAQLALLEGPLREHLEGFRSPVAPPGGNERPCPYGPLDAEVLHAMIRHLRPSRVLELGSGVSSLVIAGALERNATEGTAGAHEIVDPFPSPLLRRLGDRVTVRPVPAQEVDPATVDTLSPGDVLFIDTTHAVKPGGDVTHLWGEVVPRVPPGVVVHVHDVFRPFEYPRALYEDLRVFWQEHHLVQAFLAFNDRFTVLLAHHLLTRTAPDRIRALVPSYVGDTVPNALWLRRER